VQETIERGSAKLEVKSLINIVGENHWLLARASGKPPSGAYLLKYAFKIGVHREISSRILELAHRFRVY
jgi:hypothetical protein